MKSSNVIAVCTHYTTEAMLDNFLDSIKGYKGYSIVIIVNDWSKSPKKYLDKIKELELKGLKIFDDIFSVNKSVAISPGFGSYNGKYKRSILKTMTFPLLNRSNQVDL